MRLLDASLCLALAAEIHRSDRGVKETAKRLAKRVERRHRHLLHGVINHKSPLWYIVNHTAHMPDEVIYMDTTAKPAPHIQLAQAKAAAAAQASEGLAQSGLPRPTR